MSRYTAIRPDWTAIREPDRCRSRLGSDSETIERNGLHLRNAGERVGLEIGERLRGKKVLIVGGPADFEGYARGLQHALERSGIETMVACLWMATSKLSSLERSATRQVIRSYVDPDHGECSYAVSAHNVIDDAATAMTALLWASHKAPKAECSVAVHKITADTLDELKDETETCFGKPLAFRVDSSYDNERELLPHHPYRDYIGIDDDIAYVPPAVQARRELRIYSTSPEPKN